MSVWPRVVVEAAPVRAGGRVPGPLQPPAPTGASAAVMLLPTSRGSGFVVSARVVSPEGLKFTHEKQIIIR